LLKQVRIVTAGLQSQLVKTLGATTPVAELAKKLATIPPQQLIYFQRSKIAIEELFRSHVEVRLPTVSAQTVAVRELLRGQILAFRSLRAGELPADALRWDPAAPVRVAPPPPPPPPLDSHAKPSTRCGSSRTMARASTGPAAAPTDCTTRHTSSSSKELARPAQAAPSTYRAKPTSNTGRRP
jgi:hypothetical protein